MSEKASFASPLASKVSEKGRGGEPEGLGRGGMAPSNRPYFDRTVGIGRSVGELTCL